VNLLRGHRPLEDADRTMLADYIATFPGGQGLLRAPPLGEQDFDLLAAFIVAVNRGRGRYRDEEVRAVARTAEALKPLARGVAEALKPHLSRLGQKMRDLDLEPENEKYKALEATANLAQDPDEAAIDRAIELEIGQLPDDETGGAAKQGSEPSQPPIGPPLLTPVTRVIRAVPARETNGTVLLSTVEQESPRAEPRRHCRRVH